ncbi:hypothetical protein [Lawsonibacter sp. JLR.KK007]|uniref:hypothetical protein n=1 Tax=Lawsonibacter sp. JLR.KK007 TaxID=3114293 RepID=UPI002FF29A01
MKKTKRILTVLFLAVLLISALCVPAFALTESEVEAQVAASGKESVTGNVLIWFLCAVAFLKVSQKIDSFMATLGVNVGRTGGSMLAEAMIAMRAVTMVVGGGHGAGAGRAGSAAGSAVGKSGSSGMTGFFKGGLIGMAGRHITNSAVRTATTQTSAVHTAQSQVQQAAASTAAAQTSADTNINSEVHTGGSSIHTGNAAPAGTPPQEGIIVTGGGAPLTAPADNIPQAASAINSEVHTGGSHSHTQNDAAVGPPPQEGVIVTGGGAAPQMLAVESAPPAGPIPDGAPPQEGVILNGTEPAAIPQTDPAPQSVGTPPESVPPDMSQPQEGIVLTGGEQSVHAAQTENIFGGGTDGTVHVENTAVTGGGQQTQTHTERVQTAHTAVSSEKVQTNRFLSGSGTRPTLGGMVFSRSLAAGGSFANDVIGTVARGEVAGSITGDMAAQSLSSYMGYASPGIGSREAPVYSDVEIGRGRITGVETAAGTKEGLSFAMYHVDQYTAPSGDYTKVVSADGTQWYKQYAQDAVERKPYMAPDDTVAYHERIIKKLPDPPKRKDRI